MNPFDFPPIAAILELAASALAALGAVVTPPARSCSSRSPCAPC
ncbi:hypothetical protein [Homoserinibacter gongjuensis]|nr:hypothetical protein [Homoserinibacter gongjuensis]